MSSSRSVQQSNSTSSTHSYDLERDIFQRWKNCQFDPVDIVCQYLGVQYNPTISDCVEILVGVDFIAESSSFINKIKQHLLSKIKTLALDILCLEENTSERRKTLSQILNFELANRFPLPSTPRLFEPQLNAKIDFLINHINSIQLNNNETKMSFNNLLNIVCHKISLLSSDLSLFKDLVSIPTLQVNEYDMTDKYFMDLPADRFAPIHHLVAAGFNSSLRKSIQHCFEELLKFDLDINKKTGKLGNTALHLAAMNCDAETLKVLINLPGIDLLAKNNEDKTALEVLRINQHHLFSKDYALPILENAVKNSSASGAHKMYYRHKLKATFFGSSKNAKDALTERPAELFATALVAVLGRALVGGFVPRI